MRARRRNEGVDIALDVGEAGGIDAGIEQFGEQIPLVHRVAHPLRTCGIGAAAGGADPTAPGASAAAGSPAAGEGAAAAVPAPASGERQGENRGNDGATRIHC